MRIELYIMIILLIIAVILIQVRNFNREVKSDIKAIEELPEDIRYH